MQRVIIVDNEKPALDLLERILKSMPDVEIVGAFQKPSQVLANIELLKPDAAFLDIEMPGINGIELAIKITEINPDIDFIFVTAFDHYAIEAFEINAIDYLLKPIIEEKLQRALDRLGKKKEQKKNELTNVDKQSIFIKMLGIFEVAGAGKKNVRWMTAKVEELFAILLLHNYPISKWVLMDMLWPDSEPQKAEQNLYTTVFRLKQTLKDENLNIGIEINKGAYKLQFDNLHWDVGILLEAKATQELAQMEKALDHYQGELLAEKDYLWSYELRQKFSNDYGIIAIKLAKTYISEEKFANSIDVLEKMQRYSPCNCKGSLLLEELLVVKNLPKDLNERIRMLLEQQEADE